METPTEALAWPTPRSTTRGRARHRQGARASALLLVGLALSCGDAPPSEPAQAPVTIAEVTIERLEQARIKTACNEAKMLETAVEMFVLTNQECPKSVPELQQAGFIARAVVDPWEHPYALACPDDEIRIRSGGPDGVVDTDDDLVVGNGAVGCE